MRSPAHVRALPFLLLLLAVAPAHAAGRPVAARALNMMGLWQATPAVPTQQAAPPSTSDAAQPNAPAPAQPSAPVAVQPSASTPAQPGASVPVRPSVSTPVAPSPAPTVQTGANPPVQLNPPAPDSNELRITGLGGGSAQWTIVVLLTFLTLIPSILICMTPFARLLIVFHFLRQALGLQTTPSNQTLIGLSVIMTFFLMQPIGATIYSNSVVPMQQGKITAVDALTRASVPMRQFMSHYVREKDAALFLEIAKEPRPANINDLSFRVLLPAYILSELKAGFQIGAVLFLPFLVVDMVVASITTSVGMMQLPPVVISTPVKILLFVMVDGWNLLAGSLLKSF